MVLGKVIVAIEIVQGIPKEVSLNNTFVHNTSVQFILTHKSNLPLKLFIALFSPREEQFRGQQERVRQP